MTENTPSNTDKDHQEGRQKDRQKDRLGSLLENKDRKAPGQSYSRLIRALRIFFPLAALGIMGVTILLAQSGEEFSQSREDFTLDRPATNELTKPRFESRDAKERPYTITANKAIQSQTQKDKIFLDRPIADMTMGNGDWVAIEADQGEYTENQEQLFLQGNVRLFQDNGYSMLTDKIWLNLEESTAHSDQPVQAHGPAGKLDAQGLTAQQKQNTITFKGPAKLILYNSEQ